MLLRPQNGLRKLDNTAVIELTTAIVEWCITTLGKSKYKRSIPSLLLNKYDAVCIAYYAPKKNIIQIYTDNCKTVSGLISAIIHEWQHYTQPIKRDYAKLLEEHGYDEHPFEIAARGAEKYWKRIATKQILHNLTLTYAER